MAKVRAMAVPSAGAAFKLEERETPVPGRGEVRLRVQACGICHSDWYTKEGHWPGIEYPRVPGHEIAGVVEELGPDVKGFEVGARAGVGWHGGHCGYCESCRRGDFLTCRVVHRIPGITVDGGYADAMIVPAVALARIPDALTPVEAAPLMCAGVTCFNSLRNAGARSGDRVAVLGLGGLGHLGVQFASKMGFETIAIARGKDKEALALKLGAHRYIDSEVRDAGEELQAIGGADLVLATVTSGKAMNAVLGGLGINGKLVVLGAADEPLQVPAHLLIGGRRSIVGWPSGSSIDSEDTLAFSAANGVRPMTEVFPLERASEAYERMLSGKARFRVVLTSGR
jgi:alcohol dehydrogenase/propanol-preferring alcohol dehydrogenase